jgi:hypothetical protein
MEKEHMVLRDMAAAALAALAIGLAGPTAMAQQDASGADVLQASYDAFTSAYARGDMPAAEAAVRTSLEAHAAAELGDDTRAVLLINLAIVLIEQGQGAAAQGAISQILGLESSAYTPYAPLISMLEATADFQTDPVNGARDAAPVLEAAALSDVTVARYGLRLALGSAQAAMAAQDFRTAERAWASAARFSAAAADPTELMRGRALTGQGAALLFGGDPARAASVLTTAMEALAPLAGETRDPVPGVAERAFAEAMAWRGAARAVIITEGADDNAAGEPRIQPAALPDAAPLCPVRIEANPAPETPTLRGGRSSVGSVVIGLSMDSAGRVTGAEVISFAPDPALATAVERVLPRWRFTRSPNAAEGCRMERTRELRLIVLRGGEG